MTFAAWALLGLSLSAAKPSPLPYPDAVAHSDTPPPSTFDSAPTAAATPQALTDNQLGLLGASVRTVVALCFVVLLAVVLLRGLLPRLLTSFRQSEAHGLQLVAKLALGPKHAVMVVEVAPDVRLVLGTSETQVTLLTQLPLRPQAKPFADTLSAVQATTPAPAVADAGVPRAAQS